MPQPITIDVWSDIACPWCYIGKRHLEAGLQVLEEAGVAPPVEVEFHSFQLSPDTPVDFDGTAADYLVRHKGISEAQARQMLDRVTGIARAAGLDYHFERVQHTNTVKAHQVLHYAKAHGAHAEAKERLLSAYFVEGRHVGRDDELADLAADIDLDRDDVLRSLRDDEYLDAVRADEETARQYGISGVPFFVLDGRYGISGAQPPEVFARALARVAEERGDAAVAS